MTVFNELRMRPATAGRQGWDASTTARLVMAGAVIFTLLVGANLATPLYPLLQANLGLSALGVTAAFASYVLALVVTLMLAGHWSDHIGRRAALILAVLAGLAGSWVFSQAENLVVLSAGRALQGVAVALATGASAAALRELLPTRPEWATRFTLLATAGGWQPVRSSAACCRCCRAHNRPVLRSRARPGGNAGAAIPASGPAGHQASGRPAARPGPGSRRPSVSTEARGAFWLAAAVGFLSFSVFGFCLSLAPAYFAPIIQTDSRPLIGALAGMTLAASALSQVLSVRGRFVVPVGLAVLGASVLLLAAAAAWSSPLLLAGASVCAGLGQGVAFRTVFNDVAAKVESSQHAQVISTVYVITYLGSAVPVIGLGWATAVFGLPTAVAGFVALCSAAALALSAVTLRAAL
ncbi:hypothetical protein AHiyo4_34550 [Arthrobacter sp. Hiyo4]|nr:hypothetical protein AHiyo4_34550 [Arthrobacter sp. Hiyo4]